MIKQEKLSPENHNKVGEMLRKHGTKHVLWTMALAQDIYGMNLNQFMNFLNSWKVVKGFPRKVDKQ